MCDLELSDSLDNAQREHYCQLIAKGESSRGQAYKVAQVSLGVAAALSAAKCAASGLSAQKVPGAGKAEQ